MNNGFIIISNNCDLLSRSQQVEGCGAKPNTEVEKFEQGCYSLFKAKFIDNIAIVGGDIDHNVIDLTWQVGHF